jgi:hypothetical protein
VKLPPLRVPQPSNIPPEPFIKLIRTTEDVKHGGREDGEQVQVHCGACLKRAFDLTILWHFNWTVDDYPDWSRTNSVKVSRMCPNCGLVHHKLVTLTPGHPLSDGFHGAWFCPAGCASHGFTSLGFIDANMGRVKASCCGNRCRANVTTTAHRAFFGNLKHVDTEKARRRSEYFDPAPF